MDEEIKLSEVQQSINNSEEIVDSSDNALSDSTFENNIQKLSILKGLRSLFKEFASNLIEQGNAFKKSNFTKHPSKIFSEGAWIQLLFLVRFWIEDRSPGFEKTDIAIEKSVRSVFDLFDNTPLDSIVDFGKFLWEEKIKTN